MGHTSGYLKPPRRELKRKLPTASVSTAPTPSSPIEESAPTIQEIINHSTFDHSYSNVNDTENSHKKFKCNCLGDTCNCCIGCLEQSVLIQVLKDKIEELEKELKQKKSNKTNLTNKKPFHKSILSSDKKTKFYTGLPSTDLFYKLYYHLHPKIFMYAILAW